MFDRMKRSVTVIAALIGGIFVVIAAIITVFPSLLPKENKLTLPFSEKYDDPSGLFSIELPSIFKIAEREYSTDHIDVIWRLDKERLNFDIPKKNYYYIAVYVYIFPLPDGVVFDQYTLNAIRNGENNDFFEKGMGKFNILDQFTVGDSVVLNNERTEKGFILKERVTSANPELYPNIVLYELHEVDSTGFSIVDVVMNEQAYTDFGIAFGSVIHSYIWKSFEPPH